MPRDDQEIGASREILCRLLAACYYEPGPEFAEEKVFASLYDAAARFDPDFAGLARRMGEEFGAAGHDILLVDYARLFLGPVNIAAKPYGSVWLDRETTLMQDSTMAVLELYAEGGFEIDEAFRELPDHIAAELEFLYLLIYRENEARRNDDSEALMAASALRRRFLDQHLGKWVGCFTAAMRDGAQTGFYRELADLTERFVRREAGESGVV